jgi:hypothetical protein
VETKVVKSTILIQPRPSPLNLYGVQFYVVREDLQEEFKQRFLKQNESFVYIAISVKDYENLAKNVSEFERYIKQQQSLIQYYESAITKN